MRYKEFNRNAVLEKCIPLFWKNGFRACAISDIVKETSVNRFSLYEEFGSKEGILLAALKLYQDRYSTMHFKLLAQEGATERILNQFYLSFFKESNHPEGCFVIHIGTELADTDLGVKAFLNDYIQGLQKSFTQLLDIDPDTAPNSAFYARNLIGLFCTSMSFCLIHSEQERLNHINNGIQVILNKLSYA